MRIDIFASCLVLRECQVLLSCLEHLSPLVHPGFHNQGCLADLCLLGRQPDLCHQGDLGLLLTAETPADHRHKHV